ncbi:unnamed protein product, partial [Iphiclides podalirius]
MSKLGECHRRGAPSRGRSPRGPGLGGGGDREEGRATDSRGGFRGRGQRPRPPRGGERARQCQGRCSGQLTSGDARGPRLVLRGAVGARPSSEVHVSAEPPVGERAAAARATPAPGLSPTSQALVGVHLPCRRLSTGTWRQHVETTKAPGARRYQRGRATVSHGARLTTAVRATPGGIPRSRVGHRTPKRRSGRRRLKLVLVYFSVGAVAWTARIPFAKSASRCSKRPLLQTVRERSLREHEDGGRDECSARDTRSVPPAAVTSAALFFHRRYHGHSIRVFTFERAPTAAGTRGAYRHT